MGVIEESTKSNKPLVSMVLAVNSCENLYRYFKSIAIQDYERFEVILVNNDERIESHIIKKELKKISNFHRLKIIDYNVSTGYRLFPVTQNELFYFGAKYANGDYLVFTDDHTGFKHSFISDMVSRAVSEDVELAYSDFAVIWNSDSAFVYRTELLIDENNTPLDSLFDNSGKMYGFTMSNNKLIKRCLWEKTAPIIHQYYSDNENSADFLSGEVLLTYALWINVTSVAYIKDTYSIIEWVNSDNDARRYCEKRNTDDIAKEFLNLYGYLCSLSESESNEAFAEYFFSYILGQLVWRTEWLENDIYDKLTEIIRKSPLRYSMDVFSGEVLPIELEKEYGENITSDISDKDIRIYVSMHKPSYIPKNNKYLIPIQVGAALAEEYFSDMLHDDDGDNISSKNKMYCEMTAQYWAWKNKPDADYYGFWHYRRYFSFNPNDVENSWGVIPYPVLNEAALEESMIDEKHIEEICDNYDIILPNAWHCVEEGKEMTIYEHWCKHFNKNDMDTTVKVIMKKYPEFYSAVTDVLQSTSAIFCNMFIMKKEFFEEYSSFCFDVLEEVEKLIDQKNYNVEEYRTLGHIAERLLAFYIRYIETSRPETDICYLGRVQYGDTRPIANIIHPGKEKCVSVMLACDNNYMKYTDVLLRSIADNASDDYYYDIVICHRNITEYNQKIAKTVFSGKKNMMLRFADVTRNFEEYGKVHIDRHLTYETYYRFLVLDIFKNYKRVLYLDCDMVVDEDIANLFFLPMEDEYIAAVRDYDFIASSLRQKEFYQQNILKHIKIDDSFNYFQAGVILFNLTNLQDKYTSEKLFRVALSRKWYFHDQDVLNALFNGHIKYIDDKWNVFTLLDPNSERETLLTTVLPAGFAESYKKSIQHPCIIHYAGVPKVWNDTNVDLGYIFWKYARKSPYYEELLQTLIRGEGVKTGWAIFVNRTAEGSGAKFFTIKTINEHWTSDYVVIDFMFLSDHQTIATDTMTIAASMFPHETEGSWLDIKQFVWEKKVPVIADNVMIRTNNNREIEVFIKSLGIYTGFSFTVRTLESRSILKPTIELNNQRFINNPIVLPSGLRKGGA